MDRSALTAVRAVSSEPRTRNLTRAGQSQAINRLQNKFVTVNSVGATALFQATTGNEVIQAAVNTLNALGRGEMRTLSSLDMTQRVVDSRSNASSRSPSPISARESVISAAVDHTTTLRSASSRPASTVARRRLSSKPHDARTVGQDDVAVPVLRAPRSTPAPKGDGTGMTSFPKQLARDLQRARRLVDPDEPNLSLLANDSLIPVLCDGGIVENPEKLCNLTPSPAALVSALYSPQQRLRRIHEREQNSLSWVAYWASADEMREANGALLSNAQDQQRSMMTLIEDRDRLRSELRHSAHNVEEMQQLADKEREHGQQMLLTEQGKLDGIRSENDRLGAVIDELRRLVITAETSATRSQHDCDLAQRQAAKWKAELDTVHMQHAIEIVKLRREQADKVQAAEAKQARLEYLESDVLRQQEKVKSLEATLKLVSAERDDLQGRVVSGESVSFEAVTTRAATGADATHLQQMTQRAFQRREADLIESRDKALARAEYLDRQTKRLRVAVRNRCQGYETVAMNGFDVDAVTGVRPKPVLAAVTTSTKGKAAAPISHVGATHSKKSELYKCEPIPPVQVDGKAKVEARINSSTPARQFAPVVESYHRIIFDMLPSVVERFNAVVTASWEELSARVPPDPQARASGTRETLHRFFLERATGLQQVIADCVKEHSDTVSFIGNKEANLIALTRDEQRAQTKLEREQTAQQDARMKSRIADLEVQVQRGDRRAGVIDALITKLYFKLAAALDTTVASCDITPLLDVNIDEAPIKEEFAEGPAEMGAMAVLLERLTAAAGASFTNFTQSFTAPPARARLSSAEPALATVPFLEPAPAVPTARSPSPSPSQAPPSGRRSSRVTFESERRSSTPDPLNSTQSLAAAQARIAVLEQALQARSVDPMCISEPPLGASVVESLQSSQERRSSARPSSSSLNSPPAAGKPLQELPRFAATSIPGQTTTAPQSRLGSAASSHGRFDTIDSMVAGAPHQAPHALRRASLGSAQQGRVGSAGSSMRSTGGGIAEMQSVLRYSMTRDARSNAPPAMNSSQLAASVFSDFSRNNSLASPPADFSSPGSGSMRVVRPLRPTSSSASEQTANLPSAVAVPSDPSSPSVTESLRQLTRSRRTRRASTAEPKPSFMVVGAQRTWTPTAGHS
jgi:hypothetical protein